MIQRPELDPSQHLLRAENAESEISVTATSTVESVERLTSATDSAQTGALQIHGSDFLPATSAHCLVVASSFTIPDRTSSAEARSSTDELAIVHLRRGDIAGHGNGASRNEAGEGLTSEKLPSWSMVAAEVREQLQLGVPVTISYALYSLMQVRLPLSQ